MSFGTQLLQYVIAGLTLGSIYAIVALGFAMIYNATKVINFAQGEFVMLGGLITIFLYSKLHLPLIPCIPVAILVVTFIGILMERFTIAPANVGGQEREKVVVLMIMITIGVSEFLKGGAMLLWGKDPLGLPAFSGEKPVVLLKATFNPQIIWVVGITLLVVILIRFFLSRTLLGKAMRGCSDNETLARLMGIDVKWMSMASFALSAASGSIGGILITPMTLMTFDGGLMLGLKGFCAGVIGGFGNVFGAIVGGFVLGLLETLGAGLISSSYKDAIAFLSLLLILRFKPTGILGAKAILKA
jgi:branched-chain amino acid transport system permease protein